MKFTNKLLSFLLVLSILIGSMTVYAVEGDSYLKELPVAENGVVAGSQGYRGNVTVLSESEAAEAGVPEGYSGYVVRVAPSTVEGAHTAYPTCDFDFSSWNIPISSLESITFRIYMHTGDKAIRLKTPYTNESWVMNVTPSAFGAWTEVTLDVNGTNFINGCSMETLANADGNLGQLALIGRLDSSKEKCYYIDSISVKYKAGMSDDKTPPVITYGGPTELTVADGEVFKLEGITAFDEYDNTSAVISYEWSSGAVNGLGEVQVGTHTCTVKATDRSGNVSSITLKVTAKGDPSVIRLDSIPYTNYIEGVSIYDAVVTDLSSEQAAAAGVPQGYSENVLEVKGSNARFGMTFDPRNLGIYAGLIEKITFKFYFRESTNAIRISDHGATDWVVLAAANAGQWMEYTLYANGSGFSNNHNIMSLADENGNLDVFGIATKYESTSNYTFYIDSVIIKLKSDDGKAPVLNYDGETDILTSAGKPFVPGITAYSELEGRYLDLSYDWSEGAIDEDGMLCEGAHTCVVSATNYYGHTSSITLNLTVDPPDVAAPEIQIETSEIYVPVGTFYRMVIACVDNYDKVDVVSEWSDGAIDFGGRLYKGTHTLTLTATDLSGNKSVHVITVYVTDGDTTVGQLVECGK